MKLIDFTGVDGNRTQPKTNQLVLNLRELMQSLLQLVYDPEYFMVQESVVEAFVTPASLDDAKKVLVDLNKLKHTAREKFTDSAALRLDRPQSIKVALRR